MKFLSCLLILTIFLFSCASQKQWVQTDLYFGMAKPDGSMIADSSWNQFVARHISNVFRDGFTEIKAEGKWLDTLTKQIISEPSHVIIVINKMTRRLSADIDSLINAYKAIFQQQAVLRVDKKVLSISF
ncbi:MAG: DUF3574 domain-containing protein [Bacteroidota bacterium]